MALQVSLDFCAEADELHEILGTLSDAEWETQTLFMDWTPWDVVAHLHYFDEVSLHAAEGEAAFAERRRHFIETSGAGVSLRELQREALGKYSPEALSARWRDTYRALSAKLGQLDPKTRLPWFGPDMSAAMFTTARYMETWAHAQEIYDLKGIERQHSDRIRHIATLGVKTFGWTFVNRGLAPPGPPPFVCLTAPSGEIWEWGERDERERVEGDAVGFCQTVTQVRHVKDTALRVEGDVAQAWMDKAQCFAGAPVDPPSPGSRVASER